MKIIKLIFENINSYEGEVTIDFTDPGILKGNNQFVVCGPMGSGKSTILDAITLALYGSTDRLGRFTTSSGENSAELINKHSGYCRAEVVYSCAKGDFESVFELHKARDKADGKVQKPQCALYEMAGGERVRNLLDSTATDTLQKKTEEIIGLSYEQFIRCILIPQGEFDQFLKSDERAKAGILAKLSHTEHYKEAARLLNEKASSLNMEYAAMKKDRDSIEVMTEDERKECEIEKTEHQNQAGELDKRINELLKKINWLEDIKKAEGACRDAEKAMENVKEEAEQYRLDMEELDKAGKAADCSVEYNSLQECINEQKSIQVQQADAEKLLEEYASAKDKAEKESKRCADECIKKKEEKEKQKDIWAKVRSLDNQISVVKNDRDSKKGIWDNSKKNYEEKNDEFIRLEQSINESSITIKELTDYLENNKADKDLESLLAAFGEKKKAWKGAKERLDKAEKDLVTNDQEKERLQKIISVLEHEKDALEKELHDLVSSKSLLVASILRKDLESGMVCPVCGKEYVSGDEKECKDHTHSKTVISGEEKKVAQDISDLNRSLEEKNQSITERKDEFQRIVNKTDVAMDNAEQERSAIKDLLSEFNIMLQPWNKHVNDQTSEEDFGRIEEALCAQKDQFIKKKNDLEDKNSDCKNARARMDGIDLMQLQKERDIAEQNYLNAEQKYNELEKERHDLFETKSVDEAEEAYDNDIREKEKKKETADKELQDKISNYNKTATELEGYKKRNNELNVKREKLNSSFLEKMEKNQFESEEEFKKHLRSEQEINDLNAAVKDYEHKKTEAETILVNTRKALEDLRSNALTTESSETLNEQKESLEDSKNTHNQAIGSLAGKLEHDDKNRKKWEDANSKLQELGTEAETYSKINEMLGKKDGSDFEVFVQGIAMRSLLEKANVYLESIIPKYRLVQRSDNSIDFLVHETRGDLTVIKREVKNFSGGEKFIISLSLALAMAEFAGQNGDVECIFLDEGFGTLSGAPLLDAINALKRLSSTGKMLGIITHIEAVIQAFNKIEARKTGEKSILYGPGVTYSERKKVQK